MAPGNLQIGYHRSNFPSKPYPLRNSTARNCAVNMEVAKETDDLSKVNVGKNNGDSENNPNLDSKCHKTAGKGGTTGDGNTTAKDSWSTESRLRSQIRQLRSLSLLHLDMIDQQQRKLTSRDKELSKVRVEKYTLEQRLERMQRRTSLAEKASRSPPDLVGKTIENTTPVKRRLDIQSPSPTSKRGTSREEGSAKQPRLQQLEVAREKKRQKQLQRREEAFRAKGAKVENGDAKAKLEANSSESLEETKKVPKLEDRFLFTDVLYPTLQDLRLPLPDHDLPSSCLHVEIPSWRTAQEFTDDDPVSEEAENFDDEMFDRRHSKMELEEKKRKRWDAQRIRELRTIERMEWKAVQKEMAKYAHIVTKYSSEPNDAKNVEVAESIPVVAFGALVPKLKNRGFSLPWFDLADKERDETRRQTRSQASTSK